MRGSSTSPACVHVCVCVVRVCICVYVCVRVHLAYEESTLACACMHGDATTKSKTDTRTTAQAALILPTSAMDKESTLVLNAVQHILPQVSEIPGPQSHTERGGRARLFAFRGCAPKLAWTGAHAQKKREQIVNKSYHEASISQRSLRGA